MSKAGQTRRQSLLEASLNTASGFILSYLTGLIVFPMLGWAISQTQNLIAVSIFTVISILRSYLWRRVFNHIHRVK